MPTFHESILCYFERQTAIWRQKAHKEFDLLWKFNHMTRSEAYAWLATKMDMKSSECHISNFSIARCKLVIKYVQQYWRENE